jgi:hypothetical protein
MATIVDSTGHLVVSTKARLVTRWDAIVLGHRFWNKQFLDESRLQKILNRSESFKSASPTQKAAILQAAVIEVRDVLQADNTHPVIEKLFQEAVQLNTDINQLKQELKHQNELYEKAEQYDFLTPQERLAKHSILQTCQLHLEQAQLNHQEKSRQLQRSRNALLELPYIVQRHVHHTHALVVGAILLGETLFFTFFPGAISWIPILIVNTGAAIIGSAPLFNRPKIAKLAHRIQRGIEMTLGDSAPDEFAKISQV